MAQENVSKIGVVTATIIGMNAMIGAGIFTAPAAIGSFVGPAGIIAYVFVIIAVWFIAQSLARVASRFPQEGSFYTYAKQWGGHAIGCIAGYSYLIGLLIAMGLLAQIAGSFLHHPFFPNTSSSTLGFIALCSLVVLNMFGVVLSELGQQILIVTTTFPLLATTIMCFTKANLNNLLPFAPYGFRNVMQATKIVIFGFFGFECASSLFSIVKDPQRNVPRALTYSIGIVGGIYLLFVGSIILSTPLALFTDPRVALPVVLQSIFPANPWMLTIIHISMLSAVLGTIHSMIWSSSALMVSLLKQANGIKLNQRAAVLIVGFCIFLSFIFFKNIDLFFSMTAIFIITAYVLSMFTLFTIKEERSGINGLMTVGGMLTAGVIFYFAFEGLVQQLV
ncbi:amino acid permease [Candidatus Dependentiae bacterium]|nr:MAG: amino acid permease [Candidatus Dependentiae bacterium]